MRIFDITVCKKLLKNLIRNLSINIRLTWFPYLKAYDNPRSLDMLLKWINESFPSLEGVQLLDS